MMVKAMVARITFEASRGRRKFVLKKPTSVTVESSWKMLTDTATITMPRNVYMDGQKGYEKMRIKDILVAGDPVSIDLGYNGQYVHEFSGYVTRVSADVPIEIQCEDEMFVLKSIPVNASFQKVSLQKLLETILPDRDIDALEVNIGTIRFVKTTVAKVLEFLKDEYSLFSYMKGKQLVVGKVYADDIVKNVHRIVLEKDVVSHSLSYRNRDDIKIRIKAVSTLPNGSKLDVTVGDEEGEERQLSYYGIEVKAELEKLALEDLKKYKVDGFDGTADVYGLPLIQHGDIVALTSTQYPERSASYFVERTKVTFDDQPQYRRNVQLGDKVTA